MIVTNRLTRMHSSKLALHPIHPLTPLLKRLEANGLVARLRDVADERRVHITLTSAGRKLKAHAAHVPACLLAASQCSFDELAGLTHQLQTLRDRVRAA